MSTMKYASLDLGTVEAVFNKLGGLEGAAKFLRDEVTLVSKPKDSSILDFIGTVTVPATTKRFVAGDRFVINTGTNAPVKISWIGENFQNWFLGTTEEPVDEQKLSYHKLLKSSLDGLILAELGGQKVAETTLSAIFHLMSLQPNGQKGVLLTNGYTNIFYVGGRAVCCRWDGDGWDVNASEVTNPFRWSADYRVFSRNS